jgi:hypothetical protein
MHLWILFLSALSFLAAPGKEKKQRLKPRISNCQREVKTGIRGKVHFLKGNQMPGPGRTSGQGQAVVRLVGIFERTTLDQVVQAENGGFYKKVKTRLIRKVWTDKNGCFIQALPPGKYSLFVKENGMWYANSFGGEGEIFEVVVSEGTLSQVDFRISYAATF